MVQGWVVVGLAVVTAFLSFQTLDKSFKKREGVKINTLSSNGSPYTKLDAFSGLSYGPKGYMNWTSVSVHELSTVPVFGKKPVLLRGTECKPDEVDPVGAGCIWVLASAPHFNPTLCVIPDSSPLRKVGKYLGIARPPSEKLPVELDVPELPPWQDGEGGFIRDKDSGETPPTVMLYGEDLRVKAVTKIFDKIHDGQRSDTRLLQLGDEWWVHFRADCLKRGPDEWSPPIGIECDLTNGWVGAKRKQRAVLMKLKPEVWEMKDNIGLIASVEPASLIPLIGPLSGKNQAFFQYGFGDNAQDFVLTWLNPTTVHKIHGAIIESEPLPGSRVNHPQMPSPEVLHLNGGQLIYLPDSDEFLGIAHHIYRKPDGYRLYNIHLFFTLSGQPPFNLSRISVEFCFESTSKEGDCEKRQFAMGMLVEQRGGEGIDHAKLVIPYGVNNYEAKMFVMSLSEALGMLQPVHARW